MTGTTYRGVVKDRTVVLEEGTALAEGTEVLVTPLEAALGSPRAVLAAIDAPPHPKPEDVEELRRLIEEGRQPVSFDNPLARKKERRVQVPAPNRVQVPAPNRVQVPAPNRVQVSPNCADIQRQKSLIHQALSH
ncbi:MAG: hypothetical protein U9Q78_06795 [Chloroflexota bacterium]|nr:hypothetical protein [Chloroflexota bacterium]